MGDDQESPATRAEILASLHQLVHAGLLEGYVVVPTTGALRVTLTEAGARLLRAGRRVEFEPTFQRLAASPDIDALRAWIEQEAAALPDG